MQKRNRDGMEIPSRLFSAGLLSSGPARPTELLYLARHLAITHSNHMCRRDVLEPGVRHVAEDLGIAKVEVADRIDRHRILLRARLMVQELAIHFVAESCILRRMVDERVPQGIDTVAHGRERSVAMERKLQEFSQ